MAQLLPARVLYEVMAIQDLDVAGSVAPHGVALSNLSIAVEALCNLWTMDINTYWIQKRSHIHHGSSDTMLYLPWSTTSINQVHQVNHLNHDTITHKYPLRI